MDKQAFMQELEHRLRHLPDEDRLDALEYYSEYIDDMNLEPDLDVCQFVGTPKEVARQIFDQTTERKINEQQENNTTKGSGKVIWLSILGICASPVALPIAILVIVLFITLCIVAGCILVSFYAGGTSLVLGGIGAAIMGFFSGSIPQLLTQLGEGLIMTGLGVLAILGTAKLTRLLIRGTISIVQKGIRRRKNKMEVNYNE